MMGLFFGQFMRAVVKASAVVLVWTFVKPFCIKVSQQAGFLNWSEDVLGRVGLFLGTYFHLWAPVLAIGLTLFILQCLEYDYFKIRQAEQYRKRQAQQKKNQEYQSKNEQSGQPSNVTDISNFFSNQRGGQ